MKEEKLAILCCVKVLRAKNARAHARVRDFFIKCLEWPKTYAK